MRKEITLEVGNTYKRRDGLEAFVYFQSPITKRFYCVIVGQQLSFFDVTEKGFYLFEDQESQNDLVEVLQD
jgi:hypothetical protein